jgi:hypothetical protein
MSTSPSVAGSRGGGKSVWGMVALVAAIAPAAFSVADGVKYGSVGIGGGYDTSIIGDSTGFGDAAYSAEAIMGWRGRLPGSLRSSGEVSLSHDGYLKYGEENVERGAISLEVGRNLPLDLSAGLAVGGEAFIQPGYDELNSFSGRVIPSLGWRPLEGTIIEADVVPGYSAYPNYDLDNNRLGIGVRVTQEIGLDGELEAYWAQGSADFSERDVYSDAKATPSGVARRDKDTGLTALLRWDWGVVEVSAGYDWYRLKSNGNMVDYGPGQTEDSNTIFTDDQLADDFYSNTDQGPEASISLDVLEGVRLGVNGRMRKLKFDGQVAKKSDDIFVSSGALRKDTRYETEVTVDVLLYSPTICFYWAREDSNSNHYLYDFTRDRFGVRLTSSF